MVASVLAEALVRWQHAAGPFWPYVCAAPFLGADLGEATRPDRLRRGWSTRQRMLAEALAEEAGGRGPLSIVLMDLPPEPVLSVAPLLAEQGWYVVPVVQRWIASPAVLPCRRLLEVLVHGAWQARRPESPRGAVLVADGARTGPTGYPLVVPGRAFDNRYEYQICRFPSLDFLRAQGVRQGRWITRQAGGIVSQDLAPYLEDLLRAGIEMDVVPWSPPS